MRTSAYEPFPTHGLPPQEIQMQEIASERTEEIDSRYDHLSISGGKNYATLIGMEKGKSAQSSSGSNSLKLTTMEKERFMTDLPNIILLNVLYMYQGLMLGFFLDYTKNYLIQEKHINGEQIATLRLIAWPFTIKFLWAPFMDTYYSRSFGRRKTYLVPAQLALSGILLIGGYFYVDWMSNADIKSITLLGLLCMFLVTIQDIAVDSWSVELLHESNVAYASFSQSFGQKIGTIFGYQLFIYLSDESLMRGIFGESFPLLTPFSMCLSMSIAILLGTLFVIFKRNEQSKLPSNSDMQVGNFDRFEDSTAASSQQPTASVWEMMRNIKRFFQNKSVLMLLAFHLTNHLGLYCIEVPAEIILLSRGFSRSTLATIDLCLIPITQLVSGLAARLSSQKKELEVWKWCFGLRAVWNILSYLVVNSYEQSAEGPSSLYIVVFGALQAGDTIFSAMNFIATGAFFLRICDVEVGGTYITFLNSFANFGKLWPILVISAYSLKINYTLFMLAGTLYNVGVYTFWKDRVIQMQHKHLDEWKLQKDR